MALKKISVLLLSIAIAFSLMAVSCQRPAIKDSDTGENPVQDVLKIDYGGDITEVTQESLEGIEVIEKELNIMPKEDDTVTSRKVKGYYLEDIFQRLLGIDIKTLQAIRLVAKDGYSIEVANDILKGSEIVIAYEVDGEPLEEWERPYRSAVSDVFEMYWVKNLILIEVVSGRVQSEIQRIVFLETRISQLASEDYEYYDSVDKAVKADDFLIDFEDYNVSDHIHIMASDGLEKNEQVGIFRSGYIKHTGEHSPAFLGKDIPKGMWIKEIYHLDYGDTMYFSVSTGLDDLDTSYVEGSRSISLADVIGITGLKDKDAYTLEAADGYEVEIDRGMLSDGYLFIDANGNVSISFEQSPEKYSVKDLIMIK